MTACARVLVTGATGNVGRAVVDALAAAGIAAVPAVRVPGAGAVRLDFQDPDTFAPALAGCDGLFLLRPPAIAKVDPTLNRLVDVAGAAGVRHVVFLSVVGADSNRLVPHHRVERHVRAAAPSWTFLRPGFFAQNLGDAYRRDLVDDDRIYVPAGSGRVAWVDVRDVAEVAARVFADPEAHAGRGLTLTGAEAIGFAEVAAILAEVLGRPVRYQPASIAGYLRHLRRRRVSWMQAIVQCVLHVELRRADERRIDPTLGALLGRAPRTLRDYVRDHAASWRRLSATR